MNIFAKLGLSHRPIVLAPLAGVSDHPFRRTCAALGAELTYVEMISSTALLFDSPKTLAMMARHPDEKILGIQITGRSADETARAVDKLHKMPFDTIDINMGCPVRKVVQSGCGSAILKDPERVLKTVQMCRAVTDKPFSVKIRLGWDRQSINVLEIADAAASAGADWITIHGRTRSDDYSVPVDLPLIAAVKKRLRIPVIGNGNIFCEQDAATFFAATGCDGLMVSRGALGNPWLFRDLAGPSTPVTLDEWFTVVKRHLEWQRETYGESGMGAICMRKHLLWYIKGWPNARKFREAANATHSLAEAVAILEEFVRTAESSLQPRALPFAQESAGRFQWDPKWEMDRELDRGVGHLMA